MSRKIVAEAALMVLRLRLAPNPYRAAHAGRQTQLRAK
jgi:hypothetical protein